MMNNKQAVSKVEIDSDVLRMLSKQGFSDLFWERLQEARKKDQSVTQEIVFNILNEKYFKAIGCTRYNSYDTFRRRRDS